MAAVRKVLHHRGAGQSLPLEDASLRPIAEIVHDVDLKDAKFALPETAGVASLGAGTTMAHREDDRRLERAEAVFDDLFECFKRNQKRGHPSRARKEDA